MKHLFTFAFATTVMIATSACGQGTSRFDETGTLTLDIDGKSETINTYYDKEESRDYIRITNMGDMKVIGLTASKLDGGGDTAYPFFTATIGPYRNTLPDDLDIEWRTGDAMFFANTDSKTRAQLSDINYNETTGELSFSFTAPKVIEMTRAGDIDSDDYYQPVKGGRTLSIFGNYEGKITPEE